MIQQERGKVKLFYIKFVDFSLCQKVYHLTLFNRINILGVYQKPCLILGNVVAGFIQNNNPLVSFVQNIEVIHINRCGNAGWIIEWLIESFDRKIILFSSRVLTN